jgi:hypothetical protein
VTPQPNNAKVQSVGAVAFGISPRSDLTLSSVRTKINPTDRFYYIALLWVRFDEGDISFTVVLQCFAFRNAVT